MWKYCVGLVLFLAKDKDALSEFRFAVTWKVESDFVVIVSCLWSVSVEEGGFSNQHEIRFMLSKKMVNVWCFVLSLLMWPSLGVEAYDF